MNLNFKKRKKEKHVTHLVCFLIGIQRQRNEQHCTLTVRATNTASPLPSSGGTGSHMDRIRVGNLLLRELFDSMPAS